MEGFKFKFALSLFLSCTLFQCGSSQVSGTCGGLLNSSESGVITYKLNETYENNARCLWTVLAGRKSTIKLQLLQADFQVCALCDFITVYTVSSDGYIVKSEEIFEAGDTIYNVTGPLIYISFASNGVGPGKGFELKYEGIGSEVSPEVTYNVYHLYSQESELSLKYPATDSNFLPNEFVSFVIHPEVNKTITLNVNNFNSGYNGIYCDRNFLTVYEIDLAHVAFRLRYCRNDDDAMATVRSPQPFLITFFSSVQQTGTGFTLSWKSKSE